jgi:tetratricopeptide (TPR) repeat protein
MVRLHLLGGDIEQAKAMAGPTKLEQISIPYARYSIMVELANVELALAQKEFAKALSIINDLQAQIPVTIRADMPEVLWHKAEALLGLEQVETARLILIQARTLAEEMGSRQSLWRIYSLLVEIETRMENYAEADEYRDKAKQNANFIADRLEAVGLKEFFLNKPGIKSVLN